MRAETINRIDCDESITELIVNSFYDMDVFLKRWNKHKKCCIWSGFDWSNV